MRSFLNLHNYSLHWVVKRSPLAMYTHDVHSKSSFSKHGVVMVINIVEGWKMGHGGDSNSTSRTREKQLKPNDWLRTERNGW